jgi:hypothetical protein
MRERTARVHVLRFRIDGLESTKYGPWFRSSKGVRHSGMRIRGSGLNV